MNLYSTRNGGGYQRTLYSALASDYTSFGSDFARDLRQRPAILANTPTTIWEAC